MPDPRSSPERIIVRELDNAPSAVPAVVGPRSRVTLQFALELEDGAVVDSTFDRTPAAFTIGDGSLLPGFERALVGLGAGALCDVMLEPDMAFGRSNPDNVQRVPLYRFPPDLVLGKGVMVEFTDAAGFGQAGVIRQVGKQYAEVDFNHPLADRRVRFRALIHRVEAAEPL